MQPHSFNNNSDFSHQRLEMGEQTANAVYTAHMPSRTSVRHTTTVIFVFMCLLLTVVALSALTAAPEKAYAKSYDMPRVDMTADIQANGNLDVTEARTFDFDGSFTCVWWNLNNLPYGASLDVQGVSLMQNGKTTKLNPVAFNLEWREDGGPGTTAYSVDIAQKTVYLFGDFDDESITATIEYTIVDGVQRYADQGELYWQFVGAPWAEDSDNVTLTVNLPVPREGSNGAGASDETGTTDASVDNVASVIAGETVRAWGHGPLDATVSIDEATGSVIYSVPSVQSGQFAEARILFPASWLSAVKGTDVNAHPNEQRLEQALTDEQRWSDQANAARMGQLITLCVALLIGVIALIWGFWTFRKYGKELKPTFTDKYWRDEPVPGVHPAVIGRLIRFDAESSDDFVTTIMRLVDLGAIHLNLGSYDVAGFRGPKQVSDYYLTRMRDAEYKLSSSIDRKAMEILFDKVGAGREQIWLSEIKTYAEAHPEAFQVALAEWQGLVESHTMNQHFFETYSKTKRFQMMGVAALLFFVGVFAGVMTDSILSVIVSVVVAIILFIVSFFMERRTQKGADDYAKAMALKRWLEDFTALDERPPQDIKVWGVFMVYAHLFGIADKVLKELRDTMPQLFDDQAQVAYYGYSYVPWWVVYSSSWNNGVGFGGAMTTSVTDSIQAVQSALSGDSSSGFGGGGGFSMGGGGGFGGGGGGAR